MLNAHSVFQDTDDPHERLRVMLAAPQACWRDIVAELPEAMRGQVEWLGYTDSESRALALCLNLRPDAIVLDWRLSPDEPARLVAMLQRMASDARIVVLVPALDAMPARAVRELGADLVIMQDELPAALRSIVLPRRGAGTAAWAPVHGAQWGSPSACFR